MAPSGSDETTAFLPKWDKNGLMPCIAVDADNGEVLMMAYVSEASLDKTLTTGEMHYWSRSRASLWHKGATSGHIQTVVSLVIDCDQDTLLAHVHQAGAACHTGRRSCFYRTVIGQNSESSNQPIELKFTEQA
ncbi:MAG: phosphoribosyl-AMP cyclohydrolase [Pseudomonadota bacterium]